MTFLYGLEVARSVCDQVQCCYRFTVYF